MSFVIKFQGGLGNQMFQYAFYMKMQKLKGEEHVYADLSSFSTDTFRPFELEQVYDLQLNIASNELIEYLEPSTKKRLLEFYKIGSLLKLNRYKHFDLTFDDTYFLTGKQKGYLKGYWQSEKYFKDIRKNVKDEFHFKHIDSENLKIAEHLSRINSISVHIRRQDYVSNFPFSVCNLDYYNNAIQVIKNQINNPYFVIFSDDIEWCKQNISANQFISHNTGNNSYKDMFLMSQCKHHIIANSSFSWWGAYLNKNERKIVIAPHIWFRKNSATKEDTNDILPDSWTKIQVRE